MTASPRAIEWGLAGLGVAAWQLWRAQFVRSAWDPFAPRPYRARRWW